MDNIQSYSDKLTASATRELNKISDEIKNKILEIATTIAKNEDETLSEISLRDIIEAREQLLNKTHQTKVIYNKRKRFISILYLAGASYSLVGIFIYFFQNVKFNLQDDLGLIITFIGIFTMLFGFLYTQVSIKNQELLVNNKQDIISDLQSDYDIVERWRIIESTVSEIMRKRGYTDNESRSVGSIIKYLSNILNPEEINVLNKLLLVRNKILHESYQPTKFEKNELINYSDTILQILDTIDIL